MTRRAAFAVIRVLASLWRLLPFGLRRRLLFGLLVVEGHAGAPRESLGHLFTVLDDMDRLISRRAMDMEGGIHPKHRLMRYHDFFIDRIPAGSRVLDVGCGYGSVARSIAQRVADVQVTGIELDAGRLEEARRRNADLPNLRLVAGDALKDLPAETFDVVVLSNVLEHLDGRPAFLRALATRYGNPKVLIRVPLFERHWHMPLRRELGVNYFSDPEHRIEHTLAEFQAEVAEAGYAVREQLTLWGEIWADCVQGLD